MAAREVEEQRIMGRVKGQRRRLPPLFSPYPSHLALPLSVPISLCAGISCMKTTGDESGVSPPTPVSRLIFIKLFPDPVGVTMH